MAYFDRAFGNYLPSEDDVVATVYCEHCGAELTEGEEVYKDYNGDYFCDNECFLETIQFDTVVKDGYEAIVFEGDYYNDLSDLLGDLGITTTVTWDDVSED